MALASPAWADVTVDDESDTALATLSDGNITIDTDATLEVDGADPLTIDSNGTITINEDGVVLVDDADGRNGLYIASGTNGTFFNDEGGIYVLEDFVPDDDDGNGTPDGAVAEASGRTGILVDSTTGTIQNDGTIYVEGLNSAGIRFADGWAGSFDNTDAIYVVGDYSTGIATGDIATEFSVGGTVTTVGRGTQALLVDGDVDGGLVIDGTLTKALSYTNDDGTTYTLSRSQLRESVAAVQVKGDVANGVLVDARPLELDSDNDDEDGDGIDDADETNGSITSYGESPALLIGSDRDITIGGGQTRDGTYSLGIDGSVTASGYYSTFDATAVVIGGEGGTVDLTDGISVGGTVAATTPDSSAVAILINEGATVPDLYVSGTVRANITSQGEGSAVAIRDISGTLSQIDNTGLITTSGASEDETIALDLSHNTSGVTIAQYLNDVDAADYAEELEDEDYDPDDPTIYARITGDIMTGTGNDLLTASTGIIDGDVYFAAGDDAMSLSGNAVYGGTVYSGGGSFDLAMADTSEFFGTLDSGSDIATVTLNGDSYFYGTIENGVNTSVTVNGGLFTITDGETASFDSLTVGADGSFGVVIDGEAGTTSSFDVNTAEFADGATLDAVITHFLDADGSYTVLNAAQMTGQDTLTLNIDDLPLIYGASLTSDENSVTVDVELYTPEELGLNSAASSAYSALLQTAGENAYLEASILQAEDMDSLEGQFAQMLPEYEGGVFDFITRSSRQSSKRISDNIAHFDEWPVGIWLEPFYVTGSKDKGDTAGYDVSGWGMSGGWEKRLGNNYLGVSGSWSSGTSSTGDYRDVDITKYEVAAHWRATLGNFYGFARAGYFWANMDGSNTFTGTVSDSEFTYDSTGEWKGTGYTAVIGGSYDYRVNRMLTLRPKIVLDHYRLDEKGYETSADIDALALTVDKRSSDVTALTPSLVSSFRLDRQNIRDNPLTAEFEAGYRSVLAGDIGSLTASFEESDSFTLLPSSLQGGWTTEARLKGGGWDHAWLIGIGAEQTSGNIDLSARASLNIAF